MPGARYWPAAAHGGYNVRQTAGTLADYPNAEICRPGRAARRPPSVDVRIALL